MQLSFQRLDIITDLDPSVLASLRSNLASITANMPPATTAPLDTTYSAGASPTGVAGAPPIPTSFPLVAEYPPLDAKPPTDSAQVQQWLAELDLSDVPDYGQTTGAVSRRGRGLFCFLMRLLMNAWVCYAVLQLARGCSSDRTLLVDLWWMQ